MWVIFIAIFIGLWLLQLFMTRMQMKHYHQTVREMSNRFSGYLGVGVDRRRLGVGTILILVTDVEGTITDCRMMSGVTVFSKFKNCKRFKGLNILDLHLSSDKSKYQVSLRIAIEKIQQQMNQVIST
ncbi:MAG: transcriptional regulator GutM [Bacillota bacterium]